MAMTKCEVEGFKKAKAEMKELCKMNHNSQKSIKKCQKLFDKLPIPKVSKK